MRGESWSVKAEICVVVRVDKKDPTILDKLHFEYLRICPAWLVDSKQNTHNKIVKKRIDMKEVNNAKEV